MGRILVLTGISGGGKSTFAPMIVGRHPELRSALRVTSRFPRSTERHGVDYEFLSHEEFMTAEQAGEFLFHVPQYGASYAIRRRQVEDALASGHNVFFETVTSAAQQLWRNRRWRPDVKIAFLVTPTPAIQLERLLHRGEMTFKQAHQRIEEDRPFWNWAECEPGIHLIKNVDDKQEETYRLIEQAFGLSGS